MELKGTNPLAKHFRQPVIYFKLPSGGKYWPEGSLNLPPTGEIPVYPMTAQDEITLKTPDALMNGQGQVTVIQSCCPSIVDAWQMPSMDVDSTLMAIRIASYGDNMEFTAKCPKCSEEHNYGLSLNTLLASIQAPDYSKPVQFNGLSFKIAPQPYYSANQTNMVNYEEERIVQTINNDAVPDIEKKIQIEQHLNRLVELNIKVLADSTESITTNDGIVVSNKEQILEFYNNADNRIIKAIQKELVKFNESSSMKPQDAKCQSCNFEFKIPITFDYSNFFV